MIKNYKLVLEYDGTRYNGWQKQGNTDNTIQGRIENILSKYYNQEIEIHGSGRTDAGVHAKGQVANYKINSKYVGEEISNLTCTEIQRELNSYLPEDIRILELDEANERFHARLNAKSKTYRYCIFVSDKRPVFIRKYCMALNSMPDLQAMEAACDKLLGTHDLAPFSDTKTKKSTTRTIYDITFSTEENDGGIYIYIDFTGDGFLYHTVRLLVGTLLSIGLGKCSQTIIDEIFEKNNRKLVPFLAPAEGLFLMKVMY